MWPTHNCPLHDVNGINALKHFVHDDYVIHMHKQKQQKTVLYQLVTGPDGTCSIVIHDACEADAVQKVNSTKEYFKKGKQYGLKQNLRQATGRVFKCMCNLDG